MNWTLSDRSNFHTFWRVEYKHSLAVSGFHKRIDFYPDIHCSTTSSSCSTYTVIYSLRGHDWVHNTSNHRHLGAIRQSLKSKRKCEIKSKSERVSFGDFHGFPCQSRSFPLLVYARQVMDGFVAARGTAQHTELLSSSLKNHLYCRKGNDKFYKGRESVYKTTLHRFSLKRQIYKLGLSRGHSHLTWTPILSASHHNTKIILCAP